MSLLDTASLIVTPNAYKEGKLYSVIPSDGSGDFTFTRATTATRVNSDGLVELVPYNLLSYSEDFSNGYWTKTNATITTNTTDAPNFTLTADTITDNATNGQHKVQTAALSGLVTGASFVASAYIKANTATRACVYAYGTSLGVGVDLLTGNQITVSGITNASAGQVTITNVGNGWYYIELRATVAGAFSIAIMMVSGTDFSYAGSGNSLYYWGAQLVEGANALPYQKTETRLNIPRIDYSLGGCPNILLEPQRTNLLRQSSSFDNSAWLKSNTTIIPNDTTAPNGTLTADKLYPTSSGNFRHIRQSAFSPYTGLNTMSIYAKKAELSNLTLVDYDGSGAGINFNLNNGVATDYATTPFVSYSMTAVGDGWYRCIATALNGYFYWMVTDGGNSLAVTANGTDGIYIWGAQLEAGTSPTSYIPTTSASVTRNLETVVKTGATALIGQTEGTIFLECAIPNQGSATRRLFSLSDGTTNNAILIQNVSNSTQIQFVVVNGGAIDVAITVTSAFTFGQMFKVAVAYANNDFVIYINGVQVGTDTSGTIPTTSKIAFDRGNDTTHFEGFMKTAVLWKERLTNDQLAQLTTI